jgi:single-strand DNA-binding protein
MIITVVGNLVADPELRFTPSGAAVCNFTVVDSKRVLNKQTNEWEDSDPSFVNCQVWRAAAENVAESLQKGMLVMVTGNLKQRSYETREGEKRSVWECDVEHVGPSLKWQTARVAKSNQQGQPRGGQRGGQAPADDPWASQSQTQAPDPWAPSR